MYVLVISFHVPVLNLLARGLNEKYKRGNKAQTIRKKTHTNDARA